MAEKLKQLTLFEDPAESGYASLARAAAKREASIEAADLCEDVRAMIRLTDLLQDRWTQDERNRLRFLVMQMLVLLGPPLPPAG